MKLNYITLAEGPGVARGKTISIIYPKVSTKKFSPIGPAVWPAVGNKYIYECLVLFYRYIFNHIFKRVGRCCWFSILKRGKAEINTFRILFPSYGGKPQLQTKNLRYCLKTFFFCLIFKQGQRIDSIPVLKPISKSQPKYVLCLILKNSFMSIKYLFDLYYVNFDLI